MRKYDVVFCLSLAILAPTTFKNPLFAESFPSKDDSSKVDALYEKGKDFFKAKEYDKAIEKWREVLELDPEHEQAIASIEIAEKMAQQEAPKPERRTMGNDEPVRHSVFSEDDKSRPRIFAALEYFSVGGSNKTFEDNSRDTVVGLSEFFGFTSVSASTKVDPGLGGRVGLLYPQSNDREFGFSLGFIRGPAATQKFDIDPGLSSAATITNKMETSFIRGLIEGAQKFRMGENSFIKLGAGLGLARGKAEQTLSSTGSLTTTDPSDSKDWTGFTWEATLSDVFRIGQQTDLEIGLRYAQFPKKKESDEMVEIKWNPVIVFVGLIF